MPIDPISPLSGSHGIPSISGARIKIVETGNVMAVEAFAFADVGKHFQISLPIWETSHLSRPKSIARIMMAITRLAIAIGQPQKLIPITEEAGLKNNENYCHSPLCRFRRHILPRDCPQVRQRSRADSRLGFWRSADRHGTRRALHRYGSSTG